MYAGKEAFYRPATDEINLPLMEQFDTINGYYDTAFHESVHSTGHPKRLNRQMASAFSNAQAMRPHYVCNALAMRFYA